MWRTAKTLARRKELKHKAEEDADSKGDHTPKLAALETRLEEQIQKIAALKSCSETVDEGKVKIPPKPSGNPLKPSPGFLQQGS